MTTPGYSTGTVRYGPSVLTSRNRTTNAVTTLSSNPVGSIVGQYRDDKPTTVSGIRKGTAWKMPTPWNRTIRQFSIQTSRSSVYPKSGNSDYFLDNARWNGLVTSDVPMSINASALEDKAIVAALKQLRGKGPDLLTVIGERHETLRLFTGTVSSVFSAYHAFKRNNPEDWIKVLRHDVLPLHKLPSSWLQVQWGVRPLISDLQNAMQFNENLSKGLPPMVKVMGKSQSDGYVKTFSIPSDDGYLVMEGADIGNAKCQVNLYYKKSNENLATLNALGITNPFIAGWELFPWSFVIDYLANVGDVISSWGATLGWDFHSGSCSLTKRYNRRGKARLADKTSTGYSGDSVTGRSVVFTRKIYSSSPLPGFHFKDPASYVHAANLVSLATDKLLEGSFRKSPRG